MQRRRPIVLALASSILLGLLLALLPGTAAAASGTTHLVQPGDTLASIAESHGVSVLSLIRANGIGDPDLIRTGQTLQIPGASAPAPVQTPAQAPVQAAPPSIGAGRASGYTVKPGQTLSQIAAELDVSAAAIARLNGLTDPDLIRAGMVLQLPPTPAQTGAAYTGQGTRFVASISQQHCWLYVGGQLVGSWRCSTGRASAPTVPGTYRIQSRINPAYASAWDFWMPYWLGIYDAGSTENGIHGLPYDPDTGRKTWEGLVGTPITFGCIMLDNVNARKVYEVAYIGMPVIVLA